MSIQGYYKNSLILPALFYRVSKETALLMEVTCDQGAVALIIRLLIQRDNTQQGGSDRTGEASSPCTWHGWTIGIIS